MEFEDADPETFPIESELDDDGQMDAFVSDSSDSNDIFAGNDDVSNDDGNNANLSYKKRKLNDKSVSNDNPYMDREVLGKKIFKNKRNYKELNEMAQSTSGLNMNSIRESQLLREFRVIGLVCNDIPFTYQKLGDTFFITTSIGNSFQIYEGRKLRLTIAAQTTFKKINCIVTCEQITFTGVDNKIELWYRVKKVWLYLCVFLI